MYDSPLNPESGGTERATKLVMDEMERRGYKCLGLLHFHQDNSGEYFLNGERIASLENFLIENDVDVVINQIAFHYWLLKEFLAHGGQEWKDKGGKIVSFMHFDPDFKDLFYASVFAGWKQLSLFRKIKKIGLLFYMPYLKYISQKTKDDSYRYIYERSDAFVVMSPSYITKIVKHAKLKDDSKMRVITNMLTFPEIANATVLDKKEKSVLVVSRMDENQKKISIILKVWRGIKDKNGYTLDIVGTGKDADKYKEWGQNNYLKDVIFHGHQTPLPFYQKASIFLMASPREGWGLTITESIQNGVVPVVMNTSSVFYDIIEDGVSGYLPNNVNEFKDKLLTLMCNDEKRRTMASKGLERAILFSPVVVGDQWEMMLKQIR
jgi:glycosyltransferase involved in cell wall biosynthesis